VASEDLGDLDAEGAAPAGAAVDEDPLARARRDVRRDGLVGRLRGDADRGRSVRVDALGERRDVVDGAHDVLGQGAELRRDREAAEHELARLELRLRDSRARGDDAPAEVDARGGGRGEDEFGEESMCRFGNLVVGRVEGCRDDPHEDLVPAEGGPWSPRRLGQLEVLL